MKKLVSMNCGIKMVVREGKQEREIGFTCVMPSKSFRHPLDLLQAMCDFVNEEFGMDYSIISFNPNIHISVLKPKRVHRSVVDTKRIMKELSA